MTLCVLWRENFNSNDNHSVSALYFPRAWYALIRTPDIRFSFLPSAAARTTLTSIMAARPLRYVPGFFVQGEAEDPTAIDDAGDQVAPRMGLKSGRTWADVFAYMREFEKQHGAKLKLVVLLRHGEATHNADRARVGEERWEQELEFLPEYIDAPLTERGREQAIEAAAVVEQETNAGLKLERVFVSPLDRTLETYDRTFAQLKSVPVTVVELARETLGVVNCDRRKFLTPKRKLYPELNFDLVVSEEDTWWRADHRETDDEIAERAQSFLRRVYDNYDEQCVAVVSHSGFSRGCFRALGHRYYRPRNAEYIPLLITDAEI